MNKRKHAVKLAKAAKRKPYRRTKFDHAVDNSIAKEQRKRRRPR